jgi:hypothetical protein
MKALFALLLFSVSAVAQMTESSLLQLDRDFAQATSEGRLDVWMKYMMDTTVIFGFPDSLSRLVGKEEIQHQGVCDVRLQHALDTQKRAVVAIGQHRVHNRHVPMGE